MQPSREERDRVDQPVRVSVSGRRPLHQNQRPSMLLQHVSGAFSSMASKVGLVLPATFRMRRHREQRAAVLVVVSSESSSSSGSAPVGSVGSSSSKPSSRTPLPRSPHLGRVSLLSTPDTLFGAGLGQTRVEEVLAWWALLEPFASSLGLYGGHELVFRHRSCHF